MTLWTPDRRIPPGVVGNAMGGASPNLYNDAVIADGAILLLPMQDAAGNLDDVIGMNDGIVGGAALGYRVPGPGTLYLPFSARFAAASIATIVHNAGLNVGDGPWSLEIWLNRNAAGPILPVDKGGAYSIEMNAGNNFRLNDGTGSLNIFATADASMGVFHHWVVTRGAGVDGQWIRDGVDVTNAFAARVFADSVTDITLGAAPPGSDIAAFALYPIALSVAQAANHFALGTA